MQFLTPALGSVPELREDTAGNTRSPTDGLDRSLLVPVTTADPEEVTLPGTPDLPPGWPCSRNSRVGGNQAVNPRCVRALPPPCSPPVHIIVWEQWEADPRTHILT